MAIVYRNGRPYAYRSVRRDGRVTSEYWGSGELALLAEQLLLNDRDYRELKRFESQVERDELEADEQALCDYFDLVEDLARAALIASGCHQHKREWRRRRGRRQES